MKSLVTTLVLFFCLSSPAQTESEQLESTYTTGTIQQVTRYRFEINNTWKPMWKLPKLLRTYPESAKAYESYSQNMRYYSWLSLLCTVGCIGGLYAAYENPVASAGLFSIAIGSVFGGFHYHRKGEKDLEYSIWLYNRSVITGEKLIVRSRLKESLN